MSIVKKITQIDLFKRKDEGGRLRWDTGNFVGRPFRLTYSSAELLVADAWKHQAGGVPQACFLLAYYDNEADDSSTQEAILLRVRKPVALPTDRDVVSSMVEYYKDDIHTGETKRSQLDTYTRYEFSFSGLECSVLGCFYKDDKGNLRFGADLENFYSAHNYSVIKPSSEILKYIVNYRESGRPGGAGDIKIGRVRYSSSQRFQSKEPNVPVYVQATDFAGKRTALFGMTRTGKSNTVKKIIEACVEMSSRAKLVLGRGQESLDDVLQPFSEDGSPKYPIGQIIFDINGEYANANMQDRGTAVFELYKDKVTRFSVLKKDGFKILKVNFFHDILSGLELVRGRLSVDNADYVRSLISIDLAEPEDKEDHSAMTRFERKKAAYMCCLFRAGFKAPANFKVKFSGNTDLNKLVKEDGSLDPSKGISLEDAKNWFSTIWDNYENQFFTDYKKKKGHEWADEDLKALMIFLTRKSKPGGSVTINGYLKLRNIADLHTETVDRPFELEIIDELRKGRIIIVDLSQGDPEIQRLYSERICRQVFADSMNQFISNQPNNFIQFYFEEAHNLFPKKDDKDLSQIYNRIAKEGAKLNLGLVYATQEVSSISSNILKNTQNWFIAHLNNEDEIKELRKYYDFSDFTDSLVRFSQDSDKGFARVKTYSNAFVVPVQVDRFPPDKDSEPET